MLCEVEKAVEKTIHLSTQFTCKEKSKT